MKQATYQDGASPTMNPTATIEANIDHAAQTQLATVAIDTGAVSLSTPATTPTANRCDHAATDPSPPAVTKTTATAPSAHTADHAMTTTTREAIAPTVVTRGASGGTRRIARTGPAAIMVGHAPRGIVRRKVEA